MRLRCQPISPFPEMLQNGTSCSPALNIEARRNIFSREMYWSQPNCPNHWVKVYDRGKSECSAKFYGKLQSYLKASEIGIMRTEGLYERLEESTMVFNGLAQNTIPIELDW